jgi:hypothetical protein
MLISGGEVTVPKLFVNNSNGRIGWSATGTSSPSMSSPARKRTTRRSSTS